MYDVRYAKQALKDLGKLKRAGLASKAKEYDAIVTVNPFQNPPRYEKLVGDLKGFYSRRINDQHRFIYQVFPNDQGLTDENDEIYDGIVKVIRMWTHYE